MPHPGPAVRPAALADRPHVARVLARAFSHDAYTLGLLPPGEVDRRLYQLFSRLFEETVRSGGEAYLAYAGGVPVGGALWQRPDRFVRWATVLTGAPAYMCIFRGRLFDALRTELSVGRHRPSAPHWYLRALGTVPEAQRQGIGSALMRDRLTRVDHHGDNAYLESSNRGNIPFYERFGFRVRDEVPTVGTVNSIAMWREPITL